MLYFGFTWNRSLSWASSAYDETLNKKNIKSLGLNDFGKKIVTICNENGIIIDVSHIGENSFWDVFNYSSKPFIASHSSVYNLCNHFRNLKDDQIIAIKDKGGIIGLNPYPAFIDPTFKIKEENFRKKISSELKDIKLTYDSNEAEGFEESKTLQWIKTQHFMQKKSS